MALVTGIGGFFFRAGDPEALNRWYGEHFGLGMLDSRGYEDPGWYPWEPNAASIARDPNRT